MNEYDYESKVHQWLGAIGLSLGGAIILFILILGIVGVGSYNDLVEERENVNLSMANVQTMMQRRLELIPDLVETVKAYTKHEEKVLEAIANARDSVEACLNNGNTEQLAEADMELTMQINGLRKVIIESYPELSSGQQYMSLMAQLEGSVNRIAVAREDYNEAVADYNVKIAKMPTCILANLFGFDRVEPFTADEAANQTNLVDMSD